jgi:gliding motility-associated-like protein
VTGIANAAGVGLVSINERLVNNTTAPIDVRYVYTIANSNGCSNTDTVIVQVRPVPVAGFVADLSVCANANTSAITFSSNIPGTVFDWVNSQPAIGLTASGTGGSIPSFLAVNNSNSQLNAIISVTPRINGCIGNTITAARIAVNKAISSFSIQTAPTIACPGVGPGPFVGSVPFGGDGYSYAFQWESSTNNVTYNPIPGATTRQLPAAPAISISTWYRLTTVSGGCVASTSPVRVNLMPKPVISITNNDNFIINIGNSTQLFASGGIAYEWTPRNLVSNYLSSSPFVSPTSDTRFTVKVTNQEGCSDTLGVRIVVKNDSYQIFPNNVLTPNGDGYNDTWKIKNIEYYPNNTIKIYNSNGQLVQQLGVGAPGSAGGYNGDWDGKVNGVKLPTGTYYYNIDLNNGAAIVKGFLTILN